MSDDAASSGPARWSARTRRLRRLLFGDRRGLALFLGTLVVLGLTWRVGLFIQDSQTVANTLVNVADGTVEMRRHPFSLTLESQPGLVEVDGRFYGRNYGQVFVALPALLAMRALSAVFELRILLLAAWSAAALGFGYALADLLDRPHVRTGTSVGVALVVLAGLASPTTLPERWLPVIALQLVAALAVGVAVVATYRLLSRLHGPRVGTATAAGLVLASPLSVWGTVPKRHTLTVAAVAVCLYWFALSREPGPGSLGARAGMYAVIALFATVHALEALLLLVVVVPLDVATAPSTGTRTAGVLGLALALGAIPFLAVNALISGNPFLPPRLLSRRGLVGSALQTTAPLSGLLGRGPVASDLGVAHSAAGLPALAVLADRLSEILNVLFRIPTILLDAVLAGLSALTEPDRVFHVFVRSGTVPGVDYALNGYETVELAVLETFPALAALAWLPVAGWRRVRGAARSATLARQVDALATALAVAFVLVFLPALPTVSQITPRYLAVLTVLGVYAIARQAPVRATIRTAPITLGSSWAVSTTGLVIGLSATASWLGLALGEAVQLHAIAGLATALLAGLVVATWGRHGRDRPVAVGLGAAGGAATSFVVLAALTYFDYGDHAIEAVEIASGAVPPM